jgi:uncharacterized protein YkwD
VVAADARGMKHRRLLLATLGTVAALGLPSQAAAATCEGADVVPAADTMATAQAATLCLINEERTSRDLVALRADDELDGVAAKYSKAMVRQGFFAHVSPGGSTLVQRVRTSRYLKGADGWTLGENLAWGAGTRATPARTVAAWMASPGHRANILEPRYRHIGIGLVLGAPAQLKAAMAAATYTTAFGAHLG